MMVCCDCMGGCKRQRGRQGGGEEGDKEARKGDD